MLVNRAIRIAAVTLAVVTCSDGTTNESPRSLPGVWRAIVGLVYTGDTLTLWIPDPPDSGAAGSLRPRYPNTSDLVGTVHATATHLSGSLSQHPIGGITLSLDLSGDHLRGTVQSGRTVLPSDFSRYLPTQSDVAGTWVTTRVTGAPPGVTYLDTIRVKPDGRVRLFSSSVGCTVIGLAGEYARARDWLVIRYFWGFPTQPCSHLRLVDSLRVLRSSLVRTRSEFGAAIEETLHRP